MKTSTMTSASRPAALSADATLSFAVSASLVVILAVQTLSLFA